MAKIKLEIELAYNADQMYGDDPAGRIWFFEDILGGACGDEDLILHSNEIGDAIGTVRVLSVSNVIS